MYLWGCYDIPLEGFDEKVYVPIQCLFFVLYVWFLYLFCLVKTTLKVLADSNNGKITRKQNKAGYTAIQSRTVGQEL